MTSTGYAYQKRWRLDRELGRPRMVDGGPVRAHIAKLRALGWSWRGITDAAGLGSSTAHHIAHGSGKVRATTARQILALEPKSISRRPNENGFVPNAGTRRRIQALLALGWTHQELRTRSGVYTAVLANQAGGWVSRRNRDAIAALYDELSMTPGPSSRTRARAARLGYQQPLAWDDADIDNPDATPQFGDTRPIGKKSVHVDDVEFLLEQDPVLTIRQVADRLGVKRNTLQVALARAGRHDLLTRLARNTEVAA